MTAVISSSVSWWLAAGVLMMPLIAAFINFLISDRWGWLAPIISNLLLLITAIGSVVLFWKFQGIPSAFYLPWFTLGEKILQAGILLDDDALLMVLVVSVVSFLVHLFSIGYMADDRALTRYFSMLGFFTFAMLGLVMSSNLLMLFGFWELVGFSSYRLIGHWHEKPSAARAATKAFIINRAGDVGLLIGLMILWSWGGNLDIGNITLSHVPPGWLTTAGICIFIGVIGKSAQFPLFHWLPDAMEGPTPVSALIHAATMVAAGVYLLIRISDLFTEDALTIISITGCVTAILGAAGALVQYDIKKILAYSTISQLGFMVMAIGAGSSQGGYLHLLHHAFFKAGLFLGAGAVIHAMHQAYHHHDHTVDVQDIRNLGGLRKQLPVTFITFLVCAAALAGLPLTSGFISKELILTQMISQVAVEFNWRWLVVTGAWTVTLLTPLYTFRLVWFIFFGKTKNNIEVTEVPVVMQIPLLVLSLASISIFFTVKPFHFTSLVGIVSGPYPEASTFITIVSVSIVGISVLAAFYWFTHHTLKKPVQSQSPHFYLDLVTDYFTSGVSQLSDLSHRIDRKIIDKLLHGLTYLQVSIAHITGWSDRHIVDGLVNGIAYSARGIGLMTRSMANGKIQSYLLWALAGLLIFILFVLY